MTPALPSVTIASERNVVLARQRARQIAAALGFDNQDQTRISTAVSEIARNAFAYAGLGNCGIRRRGKHAAAAPPHLGPRRRSGHRRPRPRALGQYRLATGM